MQIEEAANSKRRNVDRLFAIWQAIYPDSYAMREISHFGTFTIAPGSSEDINTGLYIH